MATKYRDMFTSIYQQPVAPFLLQGTAETGCLTLSGDRLIVLTDSEVVCLDTETGERLWSRPPVPLADMYLARLVRHPLRDEFVAFYGFRASWIEVLDRDGNCLESYHDVKIRYCYSAFALTDDYLYWADDYAWGVVDRRTQEPVFEQRSPVSESSEQYEKYREPYYTNDGQCLVIVERQKATCYQPLTGAVLSTTEGKFDGSGGIQLATASRLPFLLHLDHETQEIVVYHLPDMQVHFRGKLYTWHSSALSYDYDGKRLLCHFTSPMLAYFDAADQASTTAVEYTWRHRVATRVEQFLLHPKKEIIFQLGEGFVERRKLDDFTGLDDRSGQVNGDFKRLVYEESSQQLLGITDRATYRLDADNRWVLLAEEPYKYYHAREQAIYHRSGGYSFRQSASFVWKNVAEKSLDTCLLFKNECWTLDRKKKKLLRLDKEGNLVRVVTEQKDWLATNWLGLYQRSELWGVRSKSIVVYSVDQDRFETIKSKATAQAELLLSPDEKWLLVVDDKAMELIETATRQVVSKWKGAPEGHFSFAPDNTLLHCSGYLLTRYELPKFRELGHHEFSFKPQQIAASHERLYAVDELRSLRIYEAPWRAQAGKAPQTIVLPATPKELSDSELKRMGESLDAEGLALAQIPALRSFLLEYERRFGVQPLHYKLTDQLCQTEFYLRHQYAIFNEITNVAISPDGRYKAYGSWVGEDYYAGGEYMLIETETGRCVNSAQGVGGGFGWPDYDNGFQFSPDGKWLGFTFNTNCVGVSNPFNADFRRVDYQFDVTDGWSRPPQFRWLPDSKAVAIALADGYYRCPLIKSDTSYSQNLPFIKTHEWDEEAHKPVHPNAHANDFAQFPLPKTPAAQDLYPHFPKDEAVPTLSPTKSRGAEFKGFIVSPECPVYHQGKWEWIVAQPNGWIVCSAHLRAHLDDYVQLVYGQRYAWFFRWLHPDRSEVYSDWAKAVASPKCTLDEKNKTIMAGASTPDRSVFFKKVKREEMLKRYSKEAQQGVPKSFEIALRDASAYLPKQWFSSIDIVKGKAAHLIGKVVLVESYGRLSVGTLFKIEKEMCTIFSVLINGETSYSGSQVERLAEAVIPE